MSQNGQTHFKKFGTLCIKGSKVKDQKKEKNLIYGFDVEFVPEKSLEEILLIKDVVTGKTGIHLRCFNHVQTDIERFLSDRKV